MLAHRIQAFRRSHRRLWRSGRHVGSFLLAPGAALSDLVWVSMGRWLPRHLAVRWAVALWFSAIFWWACSTWATYYMALPPLVESPILVDDNMTDAPNSTNATGRQASLPATRVSSRQPAGGVSETPVLILNTVLYHSLGSAVWTICLAIQALVMAVLVIFSSLVQLAISWPNAVGALSTLTTVLVVLLA